MTSKQIELVRSSWTQVAAIQPEIFGTRFYDHLFEIAPEIRYMFNRPIPEQSKKLLTILDHVIEKIDALDDIIGNVVKLAHRHDKYGVRPEHYTFVGEALLWSLEKELGEQWDNELKHAWTMCYVTLSTAMLQAMKHLRMRDKDR